MSEGKIRIAVMASGNGSNFEAIAAAAQRGTIEGEVVLLVCDRPGAFVCSRSADKGIPTLILSPKDYPSKLDFENAILERLEGEKIDLVCLAGYMRILSGSFLENFNGPVVNIHPSLLPAFKGAHAIDDALSYGVKVFGVTVHYVSEQVDAGRIIAQRAIEYHGDDLAELETSIHRIEHKLYPEAISIVIAELKACRLSGLN